MQPVHQQCASSRGSPLLPVDLCGVSNSELPQLVGVLAVSLAHSPPLLGCPVRYPKCFFLVHAEVVHSENVVFTEILGVKVSFL